MSGTPYQLRPNKAVDRYLLLDTLRHLKDDINLDLSRYTYYSMGGPFLEDLKLLHFHHPEIKLVSIESDKNIYRRQGFHRFASKIRLTRKSVYKFLESYQGRGKKIVWLDYEDVKPVRFQEFGRLLSASAENNILKITLCAKIEGNPYENCDSTQDKESEAEKELKLEFLRSFEDKYSTLLPPRAQWSSSDLRKNTLPSLLQKMIRLAAEQALGGKSKVFQPLCSAWYSEPTPILTVTGIIRSSNDGTDFSRLKSWKFNSLGWQHPKRIAVPNLSLKERLFLEKFLPCTEDSGEYLAKKLKHLVDRPNLNVDALAQYADYYRYYPTFTKVAL
jgi:hypothetical protein